jgi:acetyl-CoA acetyltransferase
MQQVVIAGAARTAMGGFQGVFNGVPAATLGGAAIRAALADAGRLAAMKGVLGALGPVITETAPGGLTRVRLGPFAAEHLASAALAQARAAGYADARLIPPINAR